jgi:hypothetical protein
MNTVKGIRETFGGGPDGAPPSPLARTPASRATRTVGVLAAAVIALGLGVAGCGGGDSDKASSSPSGSGGAAAGGGNGGDNSAQLVQYSQCMRKNGVPTFPDPVNGRLQLQVTKGGPLDPSNPKFQSAQQACKSLEPAGLYSGANQSSSQQQASLKFVQCMRKNGVPNFPDPQDGRFLIGNGVDPNSPQFQKAMQACRQLLPGGGQVVGGGQ